VGGAITALLALAALIALVSAPRASAAKAACGATFSVLHNDRIGSLKLPAGEYDITLIQPDRITCARASHLFSRFLQDFNGVLPDSWQLNVAKARFTKGGGFGFQVAQHTGGGGGGGGGSQHPGRTTTKCPTFQILHDDAIDGQRFRAGTYQMTALGGLPCSKASSLLTRFLANNQNDLPGRWRLDARTGTFLRDGTGKGFQVNLWR
jgi:hypothetical protein